jgi:SAM-dependent methyltransferase
LACLPSEHYAYGFEPACANGELSAQLAQRCSRLLVSDGVDKAVALSRERLKEYAYVEVRKAWVPRDWPKKKFDLIVLSEFLYYSTAQAIEQIAHQAQASLRPGGVIVACHWLHPIERCELTGDDVHAELQHFIVLPSQCQIVEPDLRIMYGEAGPQSPRGKVYCENGFGAGHA